MQPLWARSPLCDFINHWATPSNTPDIITGWNSKFFDIPYLVNRIRRVFGPDLGEENIKKLSPWGMVERREARIAYKSMNRDETYDFQGISQMDYMEVFKKFGMHTVSKNPILLTILLT